MCERRYRPGMYDPLLTVMEVRTQNLWDKDAICENWLGKRFVFGPILPDAAEFGRYVVVFCRKLLSPSLGCESLFGMFIPMYHATASHPRIPLIFITMRTLNLTWHAVFTYQKQIIWDEFSQDLWLVDSLHKYDGHSYSELTLELFSGCQFHFKIVVREWSRFP